MQDKTYKLAEIFNSFQGEFPYIGRLSTFVRFYKCNLDCVFGDNSRCDTMYKPYEIDYQEVSYYTIQEMVSKTNFITFTGGEPLLFVDDINDILNNLLQDNIYLDKITLETNGTLLKNQEDIYNTLVPIFRSNIYDRYNIIWSPKFLDNRLHEKMFTVLYEYYNPKHMYIKLLANPNWDKILNEFIQTAIDLHGKQVKPKMSLMILTDTNDSFKLNQESIKYAIDLANRYGINISNRLHIDLGIS